jgi:CRP/FNR family nitrogen fixation transcriptional regulator
MDHRLEHPNVMALPMSRRDIADYLGMILETVSRSLSSFRDEGILSFTEKNHREIVLHDRSTLAERATPV